jgi:hypothetical protein
MNNLPRTLDEILKDYRKTEKFSKQSAEEFPLPGRPGIEVRIAQAKVKLPKLRLEYLTRILRSSYGFFLEGDEAKGQQFVNIAMDNGAVLVDAEEIFRKLADAVQYSIGPNKEFSITQIGLMDHALRELVEKTGYDGSLNRTQISELRVVKNREKLVDYIRELVARSNGSVPVTVSAQSDIVTQALAKDFNGKRLVVVVKNASATTRAPLAGLFTKVTNVDLDSIDTVNEETAATIFRDGLGIKASA